MSDKIEGLKRDYWRRNLSGLHHRRLALEEESERLTGEIRAAVLDGFQAGLKYEEMAEALGLSRIRIAQILKEAREERGLPVQKRSKAEPAEPAVEEVEPSQEEVEALLAEVADG